MGPAEASSPDQALKDLWDWNMTNHRPTDNAIRKMEGLRATAKAMKDAIISLSPHSRERTLSLTALEQALFYANAAVARNDNLDIVDDTPEEDKNLPSEKTN